EEGSKELVALAKYFNHFVSSIQGIMQEVSHSAERLASSATQMAASTSSVDDSVGRQKDEAEQLASAMLQMMASVDEVTSRTVQATESTAQATSEAQASQKIIQRNISEAQMLSEDIGQAGEVIAKLAEDSRNVDT
ncbi:chemotaxis protein, partial [Oceanospirillum linum]